jgi:hypothetical protein
MYLTPQLKEYYQKDFTENVLPCKDEEWALHPSLVDLCKQINKNPNIQTIFSRKAKKGEEWSYLFFSANEVGEKLLEKLADKLNDKGLLEAYYVNEPREYISGSNGSIEMGCLTNVNYFNVNVYCFEFISYDKLRQKQFWREIKKFANQI